VPARIAQYSPEDSERTFADLIIAAHLKSYWRMELASSAKTTKQHLRMDMSACNLSVNLTSISQLMVSVRSAQPTPSFIRMDINASSLIAGPMKSSPSLENANCVQRVKDQLDSATSAVVNKRKNKIPVIRNKWTMNVREARGY